MGLKLLTRGDMHPEFEKTLVHLLQLAGWDVPIRFEQLSDDLKSLIDAYELMDAPTVTLHDAVLSYFDNREQYDSTVAINVEFGSNTHLQCVNRLPHAKSGLAACNLAVIYAPVGSILQTQIHEVLHTYGARDCYREDVLGEFPPLPDCDNEQCVMRYGSKGLQICSVIKDKLRTMGKSAMACTR